MSSMPALPGAAPQGEFGGGMGMHTQPQAIPAPGPSSDSGALSVINDINNISRAARSIRDRFPTTGPLVDQIDQLVSQLQLKIVQAMPPTPMQAPPV